MSKSKSVNRVWLTTTDEPMSFEAQEDVRRATKNRRYRRYFPVAVDFIAKNNYTCAVIELAHSLKGSVSGVGFAKRRPTDKYNESIGRRIAMRRAIEDAVNG